MSSGTPNLRVGLEVKIFGGNQIRKAQAALSALGLTIGDVEDALVNVNGTQVRFYKGVVQLTGATEALRDKLAEQAQKAIEGSTKSAKFTASIKKATDAAKIATNELKRLNKEKEKAAKQAASAARLSVLTQNRIDILKMRLSARADDQRERRLAAAERARETELRRVERSNLAFQRQIERQREAIFARTRRERERQEREAQRRRDSRGQMIGSVTRVIAYDSLRRMLTNLYQGFWRIHEALANWVVESVKFSDEMERAKTVFQGLGMIGTKNADGTSMTIPQAEASTDPKVRAVLAQSRANADKMMTGLMEISAMTGSDMDEVISSARQLLPDLINKRAKAGMPNPYLEKPDEFNAITQEMVKLASVLKMSDPGGRPLKWHMTAIQELFSGTSGGAKDKGMEAVRSLRAREGVRVGEKEASELAKAVNSGDLMKASALITDILERAGQGIQNLSNLMSKTLMPNVDGTITALRKFGQDFVNTFHKDLIDNFTTIRITLFEILKSDRYKAAMTKISDLFASQFGDIRTNIFKVLQQIYDDPMILYTKLEGPIKNLGQGLIALRLAAESFGLFIEGFLGTNLGFENIVETMEHVKSVSKQAGTELAERINTLTYLSEALKPIITLAAIFSGVVGYFLRAVVLGVRLSAQLIDNIIKFLTRDWENMYVPGMDDGSVALANSMQEDFAQVSKLIFGTSNAQPTIAQGSSPTVVAATKAATAAAAAAVAATPKGATGGTPVQATMASTSTVSIDPQRLAAFSQHMESPAMNPFGKDPLGLFSKPAKQQATVQPVLKTSDVVEGFRNMKPIAPRNFEMKLTFNVGEMQVTANDVQDFAKQVSTFGLDLADRRRRPASKLQGPFSPTEAASRGLNYD